MQEPIAGHHSQVAELGHIGQKGEMFIRPRHALHPQITKLPRRGQVAKPAGRDRLAGAATRG